MRIVAALFTIFVSLYSSTCNYAVVVSKKSHTKDISKKGIKDIYLLKKQFIGDKKVIPINLLASNEIRKIFEKKVLRISRDRLNGYWVKQHFQGISPPSTQPSIMSVKLFVKNVDGAMGYIPCKSIDDDLRAIYEF